MIAGVSLGAGEISVQEPETFMGDKMAIVIGAERYRTTGDGVGFDIDCWGQKYG
jgi:hypothetical protein